MLVAVICIAAVFGAFIAVLLKRLSEGKNVQAIVDDGDPNHPDTTVIYAIEPDSTAVKTLYQVFSWGREAMAEYLYYGEIDSTALQDDGTGNLDGTRFYAEVSVSFEADALKAEQQNLQNYRRAGVKMPRFSLDTELGYADFSSLVPSDFVTSTPRPGYVSLLAISDVDYRVFEINEMAANAAFRYVRIEPERVITIYLQASDQFATVDWMYHHFHELVARYQHLPMHLYTGAIRE
jgi:hypothetical protein